MNLENKKKNFVKEKQFSWKQFEFFVYIEHLVQAEIQVDQELLEAALW